MTPANLLKETFSFLRIQATGTEMTGAREDSVAPKTSGEFARP